MPSSPDFPKPTIGPYTARYVAVRFGAPDDDQTVRGILDEFDRERCQAYVAHERESARLRYAYLLKCFSSTDGRPETLHPRGRRLAQTVIEEEYAERDSRYREALRYPAMLRAKGSEEITNIFVKLDQPHSHIATTIPVPEDGWPQPTIGAEHLSRIRDRFTAENPYRLRLLAALHGSEDESPDSVPDDQRDDFHDCVEQNKQWRHQIFDKICAAWGAPDGFVESIAPERQHFAFYDLEHQAAEFVSGCKFGLAMNRIERREEAAQSKRIITTADLLAD